jgi:hypothetical protein
VSIVWVVVTVIVATIAIPVIHAAVLALSFEFPSPPLNIFAALSVTINFVLKVLLGLANALFAVAPCIGHCGQRATDEHDSAKHCSNHTGCSKHIDLLPYEVTMFPHLRQLRFGLN